MQPLTFLLVDDDADDIEFLQEGLTSIYKNCIVVAMKNGTEALNWLETSGVKPDFIFLDLNMPPLDGFQCLKKLKNSRHLKDIPVVIYTTSKLEEDISQCMADGARYFVTKPSSFPELVKTLKQVLKEELRSVE